MNLKERSHFKRLGGGVANPWVRATELFDLIDISRRSHIFCLRSAMGHRTAILRAVSICTAARLGIG